MKQLFIIKAGSTFPDTKKQLGDFEDWIINTLSSVELKPIVIDAQNGEILPAADLCAGVIITGSHAMVTDNAPWSVKVENWLTGLLKAQIPLFGICYGHQLLAQAGGGVVGYHPKGREIGTVIVESDSAASNDPLFGTIPKSFPAHVTHSQTVVELPPTAVRLAANTFEPNHAFRIGECAWGVQFHPEFNSEIMRAYIEKQKAPLEADGWDVYQLIDGVTETPIAARLLSHFGKFILTRGSH